uniref:CABIT domain-containing protein n=1 Tax=Schistosoma curassoni TaxID=6186 RepID=A0A183JP70_9TREM
LDTSRLTSRLGKDSGDSTLDIFFPPINPIDNLETIAIHEANLEREYLSACYPVARCIAAIEKQENGLATHVSKKFVIILPYVIANFDNFQPELINIKLLEIDKQIEFFMCFFFVMHIKLHLNQYEFRKIIFTIPFYSVTWYSEGLVVVSLQMFTKLFFSCNVTLYEVMRKFK